MNCNSKTSMRELWSSMLMPVPMRAILVFGVVMSYKKLIVSALDKHAIWSVSATYQIEPGVSLLCAMAKKSLWCLTDEPEANIFSVTAGFILAIHAFLCDWLQRYGCPQQVRA